MKSIQDQIGQSWDKGGWSDVKVKKVIQETGSIVLRDSPDSQALHLLGIKVGARRDALGMALRAVSQLSVETTHDKVKLLRDDHNHTVQDCADLFYAYITQDIPEEGTDK